MDNSDTFYGLIRLRAICTQITHEPNEKEERRGRGGGGRGGAGEEGADKNYIHNNMQRSRRGETSLRRNVCIA